VEGGAFQSKKLAKASVDNMFVFLHQTAEEPSGSYKLVTEEYLEEKFEHPAYFFLRPDGTEVSELNRHHHMAITAQLILKILKKIQKDWGRPLSVKEYKAAKADMVEAEKLFLAGKGEEAKKLLTKLSRLKARCGLKARASAMLSEMEVREKLLAAWNAKEGVPEKFAGEIEYSLRTGELVKAWRALRKSGETAAEEMVPPVTEALKELIRLRPLRMDKVYADTRAYYYLRAEWRTDMVPFDGLVLTLAYLAEGGKTFEGYATYDHVKPNNRHRAATSLSSRDLRLKNLVNARIQLWVDDLLIGESLWKPERPKDFPVEKSHVVVGPDLLKENESLGVSSHSNFKNYAVGRYPPAK
jgi:hypothetical protein